METRIEKLWFEDNKIFIRTKDYNELWQSLLWYPRLQHATDEQRRNYRTTYSGIHWTEIDEDISFESFFYDNPEPEGIAKIFRQYPELNAAAIARRVGIKQSLLAAYIAGTKKPSGERTKQILDTLHILGKELTSI